MMCSTSSTTEDFLTVAWERVRGNKGARSAGVDRLAPVSITGDAETVAFLGQVRDQLKSRTFAPLPVAERLIPKSRTSGAEGGPGKRTGSNPGTAPRSHPYIMGEANRSAIGTLVERSTRFVLLLHLPDGHSARNVREAKAAKIGELPSALARSITWDQGKEMAMHADIAHALGMPVFFCEKSSPWQRPSNENTNGLLRDYYPKGVTLANHSPEHLLAVENELNNRPRMVLQDRCPADLFDALLASPGP
jgi:IS30 family transposase